MIELKIEEFIFQSYTIRFAVPLWDPKAADLIVDAPVEYDNELFLITDVEDDRSETGVPVKRVEAETRWMRLTDILVPGDLVITDQTIEAGLRIILAGTGWNPDQLPEDESLYSLEATDASVLDLLWQWARITRNEVYFHKDNGLINFIPRIGANTGLAFTYADNLRSIKRTITPPVATRVYAYGKDDLSISGLTTDGREYIEDYTFYTDQGISLGDAQAHYRKDVLLSNQDFIEAQGLYSWAQSQLALLSQAKVVYSARVVDLSQVTQMPTQAYQCGDTVQVSDPLLGLDLPARVSRRIIYPSEPERNEVELSFSNIDLPNPNTKTSRNATGTSWELFESRNWSEARRARQLTTILGRMFLRVQDNAEWVVHYQIDGVAEGNSTVTLELLDTNHLQEDGINPVELWGTQTVTLTDGEPYTFSMSYGQKEIPAGEYELTARAISDTPGAGLYIPQGQTAFWVLARGVTRSIRSFPNSIRFDHTGSIQTFEVPEFVQEIRVECVAGGNQKGPATINPHAGSSGRVTASIHVTEFELFDIYVGGKGAGLGGNYHGGWPDGGNGGADVFGTGTSNGGSGSSQIRRQGAAKIDALIVAPGGAGGASEAWPGGDAGFYEGQDGTSGPGNNNHGTGATQFEPGVALDGGGGVSFDGDGTFDRGGNAPTDVFGLHWTGGGGGGGWWGGGAGGEAVGGGISNGSGGGGGGSGWVGDVFDVEIEDGYQTGDEDGYIIVSWPDPDPSLAEYS